MLAGRLDRNRAETWADEMATTVESDPKSLILVIAFANPLYVGGTGFGARIAAALLIKGADGWTVTSSRSARNRTRRASRKAVAQARARGWCFSVERLAPRAFVVVPMECFPQFD